MSKMFFGHEIIAAMTSPDAVKAWRRAEEERESAEFARELLKEYRRKAERLSAAYARSFAANDQLQRQASDADRLAMRTITRNLRVIDELDATRRSAVFWGTTVFLIAAVHFIVWLALAMAVL